MTKHIQTLIRIVGAAGVVAGALAPLTSAHAWVAAAGGWRGGAVAVGGYHPYYHPYYHPSGCYGCGAAAGAVAGLAVGAAIADASRPATVVVAPPPMVVQPGYTVQAGPGYLPIGTQMAALPGGSRSMVVNGVNYYQNGPTWYKPYYGSSGVYYEVVPTP